MRCRAFTPPMSALVLVALCGAQGCDRRDEPAWVGTLERDRVEIVAERDEPIVAIEVQEGERVKRGQVLLRQSTELASAQAGEADAAVAGARERLTELERGARSEVRAEARARLAAARAASVRDERELARVTDLVQKALVSASELDAARAARDASAARQREAEAQLEALQRGTRIEQVEQARAALAAAQAVRSQLAVTDARLVVRATRDGLVEALPYELGERPPRGAPVAVLLADGVPYARTFVPEPQRARVKAGLAARVRVDGVPEPLDGVVRFVASEASFTPYYALTQRDRSRLVYLAEVDLTDARARELPAGIPLEVELTGAR
ncbi:MAG TPA: HlyD family efflux transporter periplasmic adaptor subunit [Steroidobacteraceae bacterium]|nr:HlyD family efflux transporter periplasmic adaptor subunit [Steroidobacteraceae bacterium]